MNHRQRFAQNPIFSNNNPKPIMRDYTKFFTPDEVADLLVSLAGIEEHHTVLEPSAGNGYILKSMVRCHRKIAMEASIHAVEINSEHYSELNDSCANIVITGDFLQVPLREKTYDRIIANPPFGNETVVNDHIEKMISLLKPGGKLVAIVPEDYIPKGFYVPLELENWATNKDGSKTTIKIIIINN